MDLSALNDKHLILVFRMRQVQHADAVEAARAAADRVDETLGHLEARGLYPDAATGEWWQRNFQSRLNTISIDNWQDEPHPAGNAPALSE